MTLQDAVRMMGATVTISIESDKELADAITKGQADAIAKGQAKATAKGQASKHTKPPHKAAITPAHGIHGDFQVRPISAMLELARGTALSEDPEVAAFARRWPILRHLGIFARDAQSGKLHLDAAALKFIGPNQRRVLSEDLGIGFGIIVAKSWCEARTAAIGPVTAIDVDRALYKRLLPKPPAGSRQPDYLLAYSDSTNPRTKIYDLLETKGTVSKSTANGQLSRAVTQLAGLTVGGNQLTGIAVSTVSNEDGVRVMAVDPDERLVTWEPTNVALERWRTAEERSREEAAQLDVSAEEFFATATNVECASLAEFSGQHGSAARWLPNLGSDSRGDTNTEVRRETEAGTFIGAEYVIEIPGTSGRLRLYQGVEKSIVDGLRDLDVTAVMDAQRSFAEVLSGEAGTSSVGVENAGPVSAFTSDGSMLELSIG
jgi:hypothetical protein